MWIQVRTFDGKKVVRVDSLSKLTKVEELREKLVEPFDAPPERQRLFYRGKQMEDGHTIFDYDVGLNDLIQIMVRNLPPVAKTPLTEATESADKPNSNGYHSDESDSSDKENKQPAEKQPSSSQAEPMDAEETNTETEGSLFKIGDIVDARDVTMGAWFEAKIIKIRKAGPEDEIKPDSAVVDESSGAKSEIKSESNLSEQSNKDSCEQSVKINCEEPVATGDKSTSETDLERTSTKGEDSVKCESNDSVVKSELINDLENKVEKMDESNNNNMEFINPCEKTPVKNTCEGVTTADNSGVKKRLHVCDSNDGFVYSVQYEGYEDDDLTDVRSNHLRPRARAMVKLGDVKIGQTLMVNYNYDEPDQRGYWYDCVVTAKRDTRTIKELTATVFLGKDLMPLENCKILFVHELFEIEKIGSQINQTDIDKDPSASPVKRQNKPECDHCLDNPRRKCKFCACHTCGGKDDPGSQILCDECDMAFHLQCLDPPLDKIPEEDEWYCPTCKNDSNEVVGAGQKLKQSKKKSKMASASATTSRDWGKGMACVGRTKECRIVPPNHFGPIPGVEVGTQWKFRVQVSEAGIHRPHVAGIHGREEDGAFSIVLSGGYEDDLDKGDEFMYTGSGGRDLSGNKRTAEQSCDQKLTRMNRALAKNCNAALDSKTGTEAKDWKGGKPVRVVRNCKGRKHSKFAPEEGNRYDGIYKVVKYWAETGKSGFLVWRYLLRRDDPSPAPWTKAGKKRSQELGLDMQYPAGYLESQKEKQENAESAKKGKGRKRKPSETDSSPRSSPGKKSKVMEYKVDAEVKKFISEDKLNTKIWNEALQCTKDGGKVFLEKVEELMLCICCQEIVYKPVTTECLHNICLDCLKRSFKAEVYTCPACRTELGKDYSMPLNKPLKSALIKLFPGYEAGR